MCQSWRGKSAVFRIYSALTSNGYRKSIKAVRRQRNLGLIGTYKYSLLVHIKHGYCMLIYVFYSRILYISPVAAVNRSILSVYHSFISALLRCACFFMHKFIGQAKKKYMCVYCHMSKKSRVGRSGLIFFFFFFYYRHDRKQSFPVPESDSGY